MKAFSHTTTVFFHSFVVHEPKILNIEAINNIYNARRLGSNLLQFYLETTREIKYKLDTKYTPHDRNITS